MGCEGHEFPANILNGKCLFQLLRCQQENGHKQEQKECENRDDNDPFPVYTPHLPFYDLLVFNTFDNSTGENGDGIML